MNSSPNAISIFASGVAALCLFLNAGVFVYTTRVGKFDGWAELLDQLQLEAGDPLAAEQLLAEQFLPFTA
jgi:hypothetical protein